MSSFKNKDGENDKESMKKKKWSAEKRQKGSGGLLNV